MFAWYLIESAPLDGTEIILHGPCPDNPNRVTAGFWCIPEPPIVGDCGGECRCPEYGDADDPFWCTMHGGSLERPFFMSNDGGFTEEYPATHWMPFPSGPMKGGEFTSSRGGIS
jgi:hypothetical protein